MDVVRMNNMCGISFFISKKTLQGKSCVLCMCCFCTLFSHKLTHIGTYTFMILSLMLKGNYKKLKRVPWREWTFESRWNERMQKYRQRCKLQWATFIFMLSSFLMSLPQKSQSQTTLTFMPQGIHWTSWWSRRSPNQIKISFLPTVGFILKCLFLREADE